jgi:hypothetical protein
MSTPVVSQNHGHHSRTLTHIETLNLTARTVRKTENYAFALGAFTDVYRGVYTDSDGDRQARS